MQRHHFAHFRSFNSVYRLPLKTTVSPAHFFHSQETYKTHVASQRYLYSSEVHRKWYSPAPKNRAATNPHGHVCRGPALRRLSWKEFCFLSTTVVFAELINILIVHSDPCNGNRWTNFFETLLSNETPGDIFQNSCGSTKEGEASIIVLLCRWAYPPFPRIQEFYIAVSHPRITLKSVGHDQIVLLSVCTPEACMLCY